MISNPTKSPRTAKLYESMRHQLLDNQLEAMTMLCEELEHVLRMLGRNHWTHWSGLEQVEVNRVLRIGASQKEADRG